MARNVVAIAFDGVQALDVTGPLEVFSEANLLCAPRRPYRLWCLGIRRARVSTSCGLSLTTTRLERFSGTVDTLLIPGGSQDGLKDLYEDAGFMRWLSRRARTARRVASVCTGALVLARAGLLDGRRATTHWGAIEALREAAPGARIEPDALYTQDGRISTSAGVTAGIDLALALVEADVGRPVATAIARNLVLYLRRPGGQSQFSAPLAAQERGRGRLARVVDHIVSNPSADLSVAALADRAAMSERHFARTFSAEIGDPPARFVANVRLDAARVFLTESSLPIKVIAGRCGFESVDVLTRRFRQRFGVAPREYRARFASSD